ncbi:MAG: hypothetical protein Q4C50_06735 [Eubacteriales bacterium]|nr:hypothetical protein [Eubacteriales bacterium]
MAREVEADESRMFTCKNAGAWTYTATSRTEMSGAKSRWHGGRGEYTATSRTEMSGAKSRWHGERGEHTATSRSEMSEAKTRWHGERWLLRVLDKPRYGL